MKSFKIYKSSLGAIEAVKDGWSWPGFFFTWIWCYIKKLHGFGTLILTWDFLTWFSPPETYYVIFIIGFGIKIWIGVEGNRYRENNLIKRGYKFKNIIHVQNTQAAINAFHKEDKENENSQLVKGERERFINSDNQIIILFENGSLSGKEYKIDTATSVGRSLDNDIVLSEKTISSHHCVIKPEDNKFVIQDLDSTNGTYLNGKKINRSTIRPGNVIKISNIKLLTKA